VFTALCIGDSRRRSYGGTRGGRGRWEVSSIRCFEALLEEQLVAKPKGSENYTHRLYYHQHFVAEIIQLRNLFGYGNLIWTTSGQPDATCVYGSHL